MSWRKLIKAVRDAYYRSACAAGAVVCRIKGRCNYDTWVFHINCLYFCTRCGKEICGRTFDDLRPMSEEDVEMMHRFNFTEGEHP